MYRYPSDPRVCSHVNRPLKSSQQLAMYGLAVHDPRSKTSLNDSFFLLFVTRCWFVAPPLPPPDFPVCTYSSCPSSSLLQKAKYDDMFPFPSYDPVSHQAFPSLALLLCFSRSGVRSDLLSPQLLLGVFHAQQSVDRAIDRSIDRPTDRPEPGSLPARDGCVGEQINFHRCVLDECQEVKVATTKIAKMCQQVSVCVDGNYCGGP